MARKAKRVAHPWARLLRDKQYNKHSHSYTAHPDRRGLLKTFAHKKLSQQTKLNHETLL